MLITCFEATFAAGWPAGLSTSAGPGLPTPDQAVILVQCVRSSTACSRSCFVRLLFPVSLDMHRQSQSDFALLSCCAEDPLLNGRAPISDEHDNLPELTQPISSEEDGEELTDEDYGGSDACSVMLTCCWVGGWDALWRACRPSELLAWYPCSL